MIVSELKLAGPAVTAKDDGLHENALVAFRAMAKGMQRPSSSIMVEMFGYTPSWRIRLKARVDHANQNAYISI